MARLEPGTQRYLLWGDHVYELSCTRAEFEGGDSMKGSGYVAQANILHGGELYEPGQELPLGRQFADGAAGREIRVRFPGRVDFEALAAKGAVKRKPGRPPK